MTGMSDGVFGDPEREDNESPGWAGDAFIDEDTITKNDYAAVMEEHNGRSELAAAFLRELGLTPNHDAIEQLLDVFVPCLKIICSREYASDGATWEAGGWRAQLYEMIKKMYRVQFFDWYRSMPGRAMREIPDIINYAGFYMRGRDRLDPWGPRLGEPGNWNSSKIPEIVTLCGSTRFYNLFQIVNLRQTVAGRIVLSIGCDQHSDADLAELGAMGWNIDEVKPGLDELHKRKIDISTYIIVISDKTGYLGASTRSEIEYAISHGKKVEWLHPAAKERYYAK